MENSSQRRALLQFAAGDNVAVAQRERVLKCPCPISRTTRSIAVGDDVHVRNLANDYLPTSTLP